MTTNTYNLVKFQLLTVFSLGAPQCVDVVRQFWELNSSPDKVGTGQQQVADGRIRGAARASKIGPANRPATAVTDVVTNAAANAAINAARLATAGLQGGPPLRSGPSVH